MQKVTDTLRLVNKQDQYMRDVKDDSGHVIQEMGPDPYFVNVPKDQWPNGKEIKLTNTEYFSLSIPYLL
jgi:POT family proton-dependent oligopeptide transporter